MRFIGIAGVYFSFAESVIKRQFSRKQFFKGIVKKDSLISPEWAAIQ